MKGTKPMVEHSNSNASPSPSPSPSPFLFPQANAHLQPSPIPPPTASSQSSQRPPSSALSSTTGHDRDRDRDHQLDGAAVRKSHSHSISSNPLTVASSSKASTAAARREAQRNVRTLPPWVQSAEDEDDNDNADATSLLLPRTPVSARPPSHNYMPTPKSNVPGRKFDHAREGAPVTQAVHLYDQASTWKQFTKSIEGGDNIRPSSSRGQIVDDEWMKENMPDLEEPWKPMDQEDKQEESGFWLFSSRKRARYHRALMNHPMVPLAVRMIVLTFSVMALALAGAIFQKSDSQSCKNNSSTWMAILVDVVAILYTIYITYDEYTSKPLGLRSHNAKMRLIFLDLAFIVFDSANLSLAFQALTDDQWVCRRNDYADALPNCLYSRDICVRQKVLTATLLVALVAWLGTFTISTLRYMNNIS
ncbi:hypothetical protein CC80DRAFT_254000 [Byssothecium circinans]|uniref:Casparian strip membrane protein domain-containing protein n=1 Tax=Byssothecium circinans TaxID=147558 RepID=A0A6A5TD90_9PLEO|nr:hypothetical protein CC80DRAFT_254000 [Byssothecium circinans]